MAPDKKNVINAYPKYKLEFKFFSSPSPAFIHKLEMNNILYCLLVLFPLTGCTCKPVAGMCCSAGLKFAVLIPDVDLNIQLFLWNLGVQQ